MRIFSTQAGQYFFDEGLTRPHPLHVAFFGAPGLPAETATRFLVCWSHDGKCVLSISLMASESGSGLANLALRTFRTGEAIRLLRVCARLLYSTSKASLVLPTGYQTPAALRRTGRNRLAVWLKNRKVRNYRLVAATAVEAAEAQHTAVPGEKPAAAVVARPAREVMALDDEIAETDALIEDRFRDHPHAEIILSMPGLGPVLGAEFIAHTGGDMSVFGTADRLAGVAGLAPVPKDSGRISGNMRRPRRYCRRLLRVFYLSAQVAARHCPLSKAFYERKRAEKKTHKQAVIALARRRLNVLWALLRDSRHFEISPPLRVASVG